MYTVELPTFFQTQFNGYIQFNQVRFSKTKF